MSDPATLGLPTGSYEFDGKSWPLHVTNFRVEGLYCRWLRQEAVDFVRQQRDHFTEYELSCALAGVARDAAAGVYGWESDLRRRSIGFPGSAGWRFFAFLRLAQGDPTATPHLVDKIVEAGKAHELEAALREADDPFARGKSPSASPSPPSAPASPTSATAANGSAASTGATSSA